MKKAETKREDEPKIIRSDFHKFDRKQLERYLIFWMRQSENMGIVGSFFGHEFISNERKMLQMVKEYGKINMQKELENAIKRKEISKEHAQRVLRKLNRIKKTKGFQSDVKYLLDKYGDNICVFNKYYPKKPTSAKVEKWTWKCLNTGIPEHPEFERYKDFVWDVENFLSYWGIDALCDGEPFIRAFEIGYGERFDKLKRRILYFYVPDSLNIHEIRRVIENAAFTLRYARKHMTEFKIDWGAKSGIKETLEHRNSEIKQRCAELKQLGLSDRACYKRIIEEMKLYRSVDAVRAIVKRKQK